MFYGDVLGLDEVPKPENLRGRGGCWFRSGDGSVEIHVGVEQDFRPARKAHPALLVDHLPALRERVVAGGYEVSDDEQLEGHDRCYGFDPLATGSSSSSGTRRAERSRRDPFTALDGSVARSV